VDTLPSIEFRTLGAVWKGYSEKVVPGANRNHEDYKQKILIGAKLSALMSSSSRMFAKSEKDKSAFVPEVQFDQSEAGRVFNNLRKFKQVLNSDNKFGTWELPTQLLRHEVTNAQRPLKQHHVKTLMVRF